MALNNLPPYYDILYTKEDGSLTPEANLYNDQTFQVLNDLVNQINDGLAMSQKTTTEITTLGDDTSVPNGTIWFDTTASKLKVKTAAGVIDTITSMV